MKKAVLLLGMVTLIAGCIYLKNADMDTVLSEQQINTDALYVKDYPIEYTEEISTVGKAEEKVETIKETIKEEPKEQETPEREKQEQEIKEQKTQKQEQEVLNGFVYARLSPKEQKIYKEIRKSLLGCEEETTLSVTDPEVIDKAFQCVMLDHPEIFYVDGYKYTEYSLNEQVEKVVFSGNYLYDKEEIQRRKSAIDTAVKQILSEVSDTEDEYQKVKSVYDILIKQTEYDLQAVDNQNICSVFLNGKSVCQGYAKALQYLLNKMDVDCTLVLGSVTNTEGHAWNLVSVNGEWYHLDATWGDAFYLFGEQAQGPEMQTSVINYDYLCVTTEQICYTHTIDMPVELPNCTAMTDNYYVREGLYFTGYDEGKMAYVFEKALGNGQETVTIKCSDAVAYEQICRILLDEQKIFQFLPTEETVAYSNNEAQGSLTFWL